jgi:hypothetical protein
VRQCGAQDDPSFERFRSGQSFSWDQMLETTTSGVVRKIIVRPNVQKYDFSVVDPRYKCLAIPSATYRLMRIARNEHHKKGIDNFRIIYAVYSVEWNADAKVILEHVGTRTLNNEGKPFTEKWTHVVSDVANASEEFKTNFVAQTLANAR